MFKQTIDTELLLLIEKLSEIPEIVKNFYLAGGTGLALQIGHRKSIDLDLFNQHMFNLEIFSQIISNLNGKIVKEIEGRLNGNYTYTAIHFVEDSVLLAYNATFMTRDDPEGKGPNEIHIRKVNLDWLYKEGLK